MLDDDLIDSFMTPDVLPGTRDLTFTVPGTGAEVGPLKGRREDMTGDQLAALGPTQAGTGERVYMVWRDQAGWQPVRPKWAVTDGKDGTKWVVVKADEDIQQRVQILTCSRDTRS